MTISTGFLPPRDFFSPRAYFRKIVYKFVENKSLLKRKAK